VVNKKRTKKFTTEDTEAGKIILLKELRVLRVLRGELKTEPLK
jgi:hypothetical protein